MTGGGACSETIGAGAGFCFKVAGSSVGAFVFLGFRMGDLVLFLTSPSESLLRLGDLLRGGLLCLGG